MVEEQKLSAYCVKCKAKQEIRDPQAVYTATGTPGTQGQCSVCGGNVFKMGRTPAHANLPKPEIIAKPKRKKQSKKGKAKKGTTRKPRGKLVIVESPAKARTIGKFLG
jgi:DNA topoisomerase-1